MKQGSLSVSFFRQDVLKVAPQLLGKIIQLRTKAGNRYFFITETEAYRGEEDLGCHCSKGRTTRTEVMYHLGGVYYVYLIYGMYWMLNIVTGKNNQPQAVLIRGIKEFDPATGKVFANHNGPGRTGKVLGINKSFYGISVLENKRLEIVDNNFQVVTGKIKTAPRVGIDYAGDEWKNKPWRFILLS